MLNAILMVKFSLTRLAKCCSSYERSLVLSVLVPVLALSLLTKQKICSSAPAEDTEEDGELNNFFVTKLPLINEGIF